MKCFSSPSKEKTGDFNLLCNTFTYQVVEDWMIYVALEQYMSFNGLGATPQNGPEKGRAPLFCQLFSYQSGGRRQ